MRVLGISGSLRRDSHNSALLGVAAKLLPPGVEFERYLGLAALPPFNEDDEPEPVHPEVTRLRDAIGAADAILIATPEYNSSIPGQLKNAIDWASRPSTAPVLRNKNAAVIGASTAMFGAVWAQAETRKVLAAAGARVLDREFPLPTAAEQFDEERGLVDGDLRLTLAEILTELIGQLGFDDMLDQALATTDVTTAMMPYASAEFSRRIPEDRPLVIPEGARNFAFLGQFVELPEDVVFTVEYSVHCAMHAVYALYGVDKAIPPIYHGLAAPKVGLQAVASAYR